MNETREMARFATELKYEDLPVEVIRKTEELILDQFGVQLSSSTKPWCRAAYEMAKDVHSKGSSTIINYGDKVGAEIASFVNGTFGHGFEIDDTYPRSFLHPGCAVVAATVALGERNRIDGKSLILASVIGYEVMGRIGRSMIPSIVNRGHHPTASVGPIGTAAAAGKIFGFNQEQMLNCLSVGCSLGSGIIEFTRGGGNVKRIYGGLAAQGGIRAALLVQNGLTGPPKAIEGEAGFCHAFSDEVRWDEMLSSLGKKWVVTEIIYKRYHTDYMIQSLIDCVLKLRKENNIEIDQVEEIVGGTNKSAFGIIGAITEPKDITAAQFSASFCLAMALVRGSCGFRDFNDESLMDPQILSVAHKVRLELDPEIQATFPEKRSGKIRIKMRDGRLLHEKVMDVKGTPANPMTREEVEEKFRSLASTVLPDGKSDTIVDMVRGLEDLKEVNALTGLLVS